MTEEEQAEAVLDGLSGQWEEFWVEYLRFIPSQGGSGQFMQPCTLEECCHIRWRGIFDGQQYGQFWEVWPGEDRYQKDYEVRKHAAVCLQDLVRRKQLGVLND